ncbi:hypothetical protein HGP14_19760 [Rhizobium sp. P32RR-XVIII]|uniref:hypothetical protein n=1 Tax=Rhizobium sp. P32RR-XVIII TaxID=2726738 RepID=UPI001457222D|nr:hypothetical protein [Rhizobium sp. P32RR-XVIII]NLS05588.1 hypothetical protein [Rhizobium sp. P32RR-XVIII]
MFAGLKDDSEINNRFSDLKQFSQKVRTDVVDAAGDRPQDRFAVVIVGVTCS